MTINRIGILTVHTSPLAPMGGKKTGGMNVYIRELAQEFGSRGIAVDIFTRRVSPQSPEVDDTLGFGVRVININAGPMTALDPDAVYPHLSQFTAGVISFATKHNITYDTVYSHYWLSGWVAHKLKEVWNMPSIHMFHTLGHMKQRIGAGDVSLPNVRIATETQVMGWADRIIAATPAEYDQLLWLYRADRRKITIIPPGVNATKFKPISQEKARDMLQLNSRCDLLLFVGRIERLKAVDTILRAIATIRDTTPSVMDSICLAIIGGDPKDSHDTEMQRLLALVNELDLNKAVQFLGAKDHRLLPTYYAAATAVIMPSDYESFGMVALEAMASGTPVIASEVGGLAFLVKDKQTGYHVPVRDPQALAQRIFQVVTQSEERKILSQNAVTLAQEYRWSSIADRLLNVFEEVSRSKQTVNRRMR